MGRLVPTYPTVMAPMDATSEAAIKEIVASLTETACAETARADAAERQLATLQNSLTEATLALEPLEAHRERLVLEKADLQQQYDALAAAKAEQAASIERLRQQRITSEAAFQRLASASEALVPHIGALLLCSQEAASDVTKVRPPPKSSPTAADAEPSSVEAQRRLLQASLEAAVAAFAQSCERNTQFIEATRKLAEPLAAMRAAQVRARADVTAADPDNGTRTAKASDVKADGATAASAVESPSLPPLQVEDARSEASVDAAIDAAREAWRKRVEQQRRGAVAAPANGSAAVLATESERLLSRPSQARSARAPAQLESAQAAGAKVAAAASGGSGGGGSPGSLVSTKFEVVVPEGAGVRERAISNQGALHCCLLLLSPLVAPSLLCPPAGRHAVRLTANRRGGQNPDPCRGRSGVCSRARTSVSPPLLPLSRCSHAFLS